MDNFNKFRASILKLNTPKTFKITNSYGVRDAYRWAKKNKLINLAERDYGEIIKTINLSLLDSMLKGHDIRFPKGMGKLELRKLTNFIKYKDGKLKTNLPVDWYRTLQLWHTDKEAKDNKTLIRVEQPFEYLVRYNRKGATYKNQSYYAFTLCRGAKKLLRDKIRDNEIDAFIL